MADFRKPNINAPTPEGQLKQLKDYLYQLTDKLNYAIKTVDTEEKNRGLSYSLGSKENATETKSEDKKAEDTFLTVKNLIIKSADVVNAFYDVVQERLKGEYVASSDFGTYKEKTDALIESTSKNETAYYDSVKEIYDAMGNLSELRKDGFYMRTGWLYDDETTGQSIGGIELGQVSNNGEETDKSFARFTTKALTFYDGNGTEDKNRLAWLSNSEFHIKRAIIDSLDIGGYRMDTSNGVAFKWVGVGNSGNIV